MIKHGNIALTTTIILLTLWHLCLLLLVRLGDYIANSYDFCSYRFIEKLTVFLGDSGVHLARSNSGLFHFHRAAFSSLFKSSVGNILAELQLYVLRLT